MSTPVVVLETRSAAGSSWVQRNVLVNSWRFGDRVMERSVLKVGVLDPTGVVQFPRGTGVRLTVDSTVLFVGFVNSTTEARLGVDGSRRSDLECMDLHYLADKRVIANGYTDTTAGAIVQDIITNILADEGITAGTIETGARVRELTFNYITVANALTELAVRSGFYWRITPDGALDFREVEDPGGTAVDLETVALSDAISVKRHGQGYRNRQYVKGGTDLTEEQVEVQYGDGERRDFVVAFPLAVEPTVEVSRNGGAWAAQTVGVAGLQSGRQWTWAYRSPGLSHLNTETVLGTVDRVRITYIGVFDVVARVDDDAQQAAQALLDGGSGIVENVLTDVNSASRTDSFAQASELLEYYSQPGLTVRFATLQSGWASGQHRLITLAEAGITSQLALVTDVEVAGVDQHLRYVVTLEFGPLTGSWAAFFGNLQRQLEKLGEARGGEVESVTVLQQFTKTWTAVELPNIFYRQTPSGSLVPGSPLVPAFEPEDRVRYMSLYDGISNEVYRQAVTYQTGEDTDEVFTIVSVPTYAGVGTWTHVGWWGGYAATEALGTGQLVDQQALADEKTDVEAWQVEKTDTKWS